ncbi:CHAT domain-containing tetratricopeptide repeat protein [Micromonospora sp. RP3T]|uniref:CHAT domain-containing tetratricopeptide repeat protein n=1 Tax=Micromonospora sp. RP3T TaxID=2135446 RepID=UPI003D7514D9
MTDRGGDPAAAALGAAWSLFDEARETLDVDTLTRSINAWHRVLALVGPGHPNHHAFLSNLGTAYALRYVETGAATDLDEAVTVLDAGARATEAAGNPAWPTALMNYGLTLSLRAGRSGSVADVDASVEALRRAVGGMPTDHPSLPMAMSNLGDTLRLGVESTGNQVYLDEAVAVLTRAVDLAPASALRPTILANLGKALHVQYETRGRTSDLDAAVDALREAARTTTQNPADALTSLADGLRARYERGRSLADLEESVQAARAAVRAARDGHPNLAIYMTNLGVALQVRFQRVRDAGDLDEAILLLRTAGQRLPEDHPNRGIQLAALGNALHVRFEHSAADTDLREAIEAMRAAVGLADGNDTRRPARLSNLGLMLLERANRIGSDAILDDAVEFSAEAVRLIAPTADSRPQTLVNLANALQVRSLRRDDPADLRAAVAALKEAANDRGAAPSTRIGAARAAADLLAADQVDDAANLLESAVLALPEVAPLRLSRGEQQTMITRFAGLAGDAVALVLASSRDGRALSALRVLETGRALLLSQALDSRSDLGDLRIRHRELADRYVELRDLLDYQQPLGEVVAGPDRRQVANELTKVLATIRSLDEFSDFGLPPNPTELLAEAVQGPVVALSVSRHGSAALLLTTGGVNHLDLPLLDAQEAGRRTLSFRSELEIARTDQDPARRRQAQRELNGVLEWLWDAAVGPVLDALGYTGRPAGAWPRVWWAPGGMLSLLPVHAAGYHSDPADHPERRTALDRVVSSYTPTIRALRYAREKLAATPNDPPRALVVAMPTTPGLSEQRKLRHVDDEVRAVRRHLTDHVLLREPDPDRAGDLPTPTRASVLAHLPHCAIAHFACHGATDPVDPSQSMLILHDHDTDPLTVAELGPVRLDRARLAYLSACDTALTLAPGLHDEAIHLATAFQLAGFPHVVGTLWEADDRTSVTVAESFYSALQATDSEAPDVGRPAEALHYAVRALRDGDDMPTGLNRIAVPSLWAGYVHAGA